MTRQPVGPAPRVRTSVRGNAKQYALAEEERSSGRWFKPRSYCVLFSQRELRRAPWDMRIAHAYVQEVTLAASLGPRSQ